MTAHTMMFFGSGPISGCDPTSRTIDSTLVEPDKPTAYPDGDDPEQHAGHAQAS